MRATFLPFHMPSITEAEISEVVTALRDGWITSGPRVRLFEAAFAEVIGARYAVAVNSCTAALHLALEAFGVGPGDEVVIPAMTFAAAAEVVLHLGAKPVFCDVDPDTLLAGPEHIEPAVTSKTKVAIPTHHSGQPCDMDGIMDLARRRGFKVLDDAAHCFPVQFNGRFVGTHADATAFSFYSTKTLACGEGGMLTTADEAVAKRARLMTTHGMTVDGGARFKKEGTWFYDIAAPGFKCNLPELSAALGLAQLGRRDELLAARARIAARYTEAFRDHPIVRPPVVLTGRGHCWHLYVIQLETEQMSIERNRFIEELKLRNIGASVHFTPLYRHSFYRELLGDDPQKFPGCERAYRRIVSLPIWPGMTDGDVDDVIVAVWEIAR